MDEAYVGYQHAQSLQIYVYMLYMYTLNYGIKECCKFLLIIPPKNNQMEIGQQEICGGAV